jgi:hypothetical protein
MAEGFPGKLKQISREACRRSYRIERVLVGELAAILSVSGNVLCAVTVAQGTSYARGEPVIFAGLPIVEYADRFRLICPKAGLKLADASN